MVSQRQSTTFSKVAKTSFRKPRFRISFQICSIGFISGVYGGIQKSTMFSGTSNVPDLCHAAPSQHIRMVSCGNCLDTSRRNRFIHTVLQQGMTRKQDSPVKGSTAPQAYRYSRIWWHGTLGRMPSSHQQYLGLLIRPKPASSWNIRRTFPQSLWRFFSSPMVVLIFLRSQ